MFYRNLSKDSIHSFLSQIYRHIGDLKQAHLRPMENIGDPAGNIGDQAGHIGDLVRNIDDLEGDIGDLMRHNGDLTRNTDDLQKTFLSFNQYKTSVWLEMGRIDLWLPGKIIFVQHNAYMRARNYGGKLSNCWSWIRMQNMFCKRQRRPRKSSKVFRNEFQVFQSEFAWKNKDM